MAPQTPSAMEGRGAYNRNSWIQGHGLLSAIDLFRSTAARVPLLAAAQGITIADYGAASGRNSLRPLSAAIGVLRNRIGPHAPINVVHIDLPGNDFSTLFDTLGRDPDSYVANDPMVFPLAAGRSFFHPVLAPESVLIGWSSWAVHWLSRAPCAIPDHIQADLTSHAEVRAAFDAQAAEDWRAFVKSRASELQPGGALVVMSVAEHEGRRPYGPIFAAVRAALEDMVRAGEVSAQECAAMVIPTTARSADAYAAPFRGTEAVPGVVLEDLEIFQEEDPAWALYESTGDAVAWAGAWSAFMRAAAFPTLAAALEGGEENRRIRFIESLDRRARGHLEAAPKPMRVSLARMRIVKAGSRHNHNVF